MSNVIRVIKNCNYTTLSNFHFKDKRLSWKAKGLLSTMLSLPEDWNYTIEGLASLSDDGIKATNSGLGELEQCGYLTRKQLRDDKGHFVMMEYTIYEQPQPIEQDTQADADPEEELTEPIMESLSEQPLCQNGQTDQNTALSPLCQNRQTGNRQTEKGMLLNTKGLNTYNSSSSDQNETRRRFLLDEEEEQRLRERLKLKSIADRCSPNLVEAVFHELCRREYDFCRRMTDRAMEQVCLTIQEKQQSEPIRMLPNLINTYLDNIMMGIKAAGGGGGDGPAHQGAGGNLFNRFEQHKYDFSSLEKEILSN